MPPSQLKGLKAKLREQGILGPQQSKKQRKQNVQSGTNKDKRVNRKVALDGIREQFNPFEFKQAGGRGPKFEVTSMEGRKGKGVLRPGLQRSREQEMVGLLIVHVLLHSIRVFHVGLCSFSIYLELELVGLVLFCNVGTGSDFGFRAACSMLMYCNFECPFLHEPFTTDPDGPHGIGGVITPFPCLNSTWRM
jgi:hypothetical protein